MTCENLMTGHVTPLIQPLSFCSVAKSSSSVCAQCYMVDWQPGQVVEPFDSLLLDMLVD